MDEKKAETPEPVLTDSNSDKKKKSQHRKPQNKPSHEDSPQSNKQNPKRGGSKKGGKKGKPFSPKSPTSPDTEDVIIEDFQGDVREFGEVAAGEHRLQCRWTFWWDHKARVKRENFEDCLVNLGSFNSVEGWFKHYSYLMRPHELPRDSNVAMFRNSIKPSWENFSKGGCWIVRLKSRVKRTGALSRLWENLLMCTIGECFNDPDVVGVELSIRQKEDIISVWNSDKTRIGQVTIGKNMRKFLNLGADFPLEYKPFSTALRDNSTFHNAKSFVFERRVPGSVPGLNVNAPSFTAPAAAVASLSPA